jgi:hypothetical protein
VLLDNTGIGDGVIHADQQYVMPTIAAVRSPFHRSRSAYNCSQAGANTYTLTVTDASGNAATCTATVTVQDNTAPVADCQDVTVELDAMGAGTVTGAQINDNSSDNCGGTLLYAVSTGSFTCSDIGANTVTLTVTDVRSNTATCTAVVTVEDVTPPTASCADITISLDADGMVTVAGADLDNGSTDNCPGALALSALPASALPVLKLVLRPLHLQSLMPTAMTASCTSTVTVEDGGSPIAVVQKSGGGSGWNGRCYCYPRPA